MDVSKLRVLLRGVATVFEARQQSKTWDIHGMPHFVTTMHCEGCDTCEASKVSTVERAPSEVKKAFQTAWPNIACFIENEASSESNKKVEWLSYCHNNLTDDFRLAEEKASSEKVSC